MVELTLEANRLRAAPGATIRAAFHVVNRGTKQQSVSFHVTCPDAGFDPGWCTFEAPSALSPGARLPGEVVVRLPTSASPGSFDVILSAAGAEETATGAFRLVVQRKPCIALSKPQLRLNADGTLTAKLTLINCGNVELDASVRLRHENVWDFRVEQPEFRLELDAGPLDVEVTAIPPEGCSVEPGRITIEITDETGLLHVREEAQLFRTSADVPIQDRPAFSAHDRWRGGRRAVVVGLAVVALIGGGALGALVLVDGDGPPGSENGPGESVELGFFDAEPGDCEVFASWETFGLDDAEVELWRDDESLYSTSVGFDSYDDFDIDEGPYSFEYELYGDGELLDTSEATGTCGAEETLSVEFFGVDPAGCTVFLEWEVDGPEEAQIELARDEEIIYQTSTGPDGYQDDEVSEGRYEFRYELLGNGEVLEAEVAEGFCLA